MRRTSPIFLVLSLFAAQAAADEVVCGLTDSDVIEVDGMLDDWKGVSGVRLTEGTGDHDVTIRCNYDKEALYLSVDVVDDRLVRTKSAGKGEDHARFVFGGTARVEIYPGNADYGVKRKVNVAGLPAKGIGIADSLQPKGWSVELVIPLGRLPGWGKASPAIGFRFELHDADLLVEKKIQTIIDSGEGTLAFAEAAELFKAFLAEQKLRKQDLTLDVMADMDGVYGLERVVAGGRVVGIITDEYTFLQLPAQKKDVLEVKVVDLGGDGRSSLLVRYVERGGGGSREVLAVYNHKRDGSIARTFAHEVSKQMGANKITSTWALEPREVEKPGAKKSKKKKAKLVKGLALVFRPGEAVGWNAQTFRETPADDMRPILLPWSGATEEVWTFDGDEVFGGETTVGTR